MSKPKAVTVTISLSPETIRKAKELEPVYGTTFSGVINRLIRDEWERRHGPIMIGEVKERKKQARNPKAPRASAEEVAIVSALVERVAPEPRAPENQQSGEGSAPAQA